MDQELIVDAGERAFGTFRQPSRNISVSSICPDVLNAHLRVSKLTRTYIIWRGRSFSVISHIFCLKDPILVREAIDANWG